MKKLQKLQHSVYRKDTNYYPQVFLEECKYVIKEKKKPKFVTDDKILMKKFLMKEILMKNIKRNFLNLGLESSISLKHKKFFIFRLSKFPPEI